MRERRCRARPWIVAGLAAVLTGALTLLAPVGRAETRHPWRVADAAPADALASRIAPPQGFTRIAATPGSFAAWLRALPMKPAGAAVHLFDGRVKPRQDVHLAVIDIDTGKRDLQQCADAVMRLRAEYLRAVGRTRDIAFDFTGGGRVDYARWAEGWRPTPAKGRVSWSRRAGPDASYTAFRRYLEAVFIYAGTYSLSRELTPVALSDISIGDVLIKGGFPGHAILVIDQAANASTGETRVLLAQSYMPAQDMHVLINPADPARGGWYRIEPGKDVVTPEWTFRPSELKRWPGGT